MDIEVDLIPETKGKDNESLWSCICGDTDARLIKYITQVALLFMICIFCMAMLLGEENADSRSVYVGLLTLCIGIIAPTPTMVRES